LEIIHRSEKTVSQVDHPLTQVELGHTAIRAVAGTHPFRDYNWLTDRTTTNAADNLRGVVVSAKTSLTLSVAGISAREILKPGILS
jgi:hypothetical protein